MIFWDASAAVALIFEESSTAEVREVLRSDPAQAVWWATSTECLSAIARREREAGLATGEYDDARIALRGLRASWAEIYPSEEIRSRAEALLLRHPLRASDAIQLGAALSWADDQPIGERICVLDRRLATAARREGFDLAIP